MPMLCHFQALAEGLKCSSALFRHEIGELLGINVMYTSRL